MEDHAVLGRILSRVTVTEADCWEWQGHRHRQGYALVRAGGTGKKLAHRVVYEETVGPIPPGMVACHVCDNPPCVNPDHLFIGPQRANVLDMYAKGRRYEGGQKAVCKRGHSRAPGNLWGNSCKECQRDYRREWRARRKAAGLPAH